MAIEQLGPYRIERVLGRGGMGAVYAGVHEETGEQTAIKVLSEALAADPRFCERFRVEVETLKRLRHPNIVRLHGYGEERGQLFFVMELVDGPSLEGEMQSGRSFDWREVTGIGIQICGALKHAHDHGVIHRDLKPANLLITKDGVVKLTDFGIAKLFGATGLTMAGAMIGTPDFMSPEQTEGSSVTARSDLFSLGCVMYALLTGVPPFAGGSLTKVIDRVRFDEAKPLRALAPDAPAELESIIGQLLRKDPQQRIATAQLLSNLLQAMQHALAVRERREETLEEDPADSGNGITAADTTPPSGERPPRNGLDVRGEGTISDDDCPEEGPTEIYHPVPDTDAPETIEYTIQPMDEPNVEASRDTHFTAVSEKDWHASLQDDDQRSSAAREWRSIVIIGAALIATAAIVVFALLPPSADTLFARIQEMSGQQPVPNDYTRTMDEFLDRYPEDPHADEVMRLKNRAACEWLRDELSKKVRTLNELERKYLAGMKSVDGQQWDEATAAFRQIIESLDSLDSESRSVADKRLRERSEMMLDLIAQ